MIDRYLVRYFLAVVDSGNFTRAAQRMHVAQPTLSIGIAKLEELVGASLFDRNNKRVNLTDAGARFLPFARRIESEFNRSLAAIQDVQPSRILKLGILNTISSALVRSAIAQMLSADPTQRIEVVDGTERELVNGIGRGRINAALTLVGRGEARFGEEILFEEGYVAALPRSHPEAGKSDLKAEALAGSVMIVRRQCEALSETSRYFTERGVRPFFAYRSSQDDRVMAMVAAGLGMTVVPESHVCRGVWQSRLTGFDLTRKIGLMFSPDVNRTAVDGSPAFQKFREVVSRRN
ncbi:LysR family transcriptional regulator [Henriciella sp.]|uniref:LysR family transcriptional regulator n=1 Tax=Henriciella sp. TaxID=1968823 RepID=UPI0026204376|nr:LysR family transcriptional regulator [Henriciella sp.]